MRRHTECGDGGWSLAELLVVIVLFGIIGSIVAVAAKTALGHQNKLQDRTDTLAQMRTAMQRVERDIRSSDGFGTMRSDLVTTVQQQAGGSQTVTYSLQPDGTSYDLVVDAGGSTKTLLTNVVNPTSSPVFTYSPAVGYPPDGVAVSGINPTDCSETGTTPTAYAGSCIGVVTVHFMVQPPSLPEPIDLTDNGTEARNAS